ncbi:EamA family transporter [Christensenella intestinihominis]|uniref:EamA family transporter n=1 Tax=Christensenella intestinihominis TaxID=1851429 RepID=UPI0008358152|nr:EamA family transporter [Christensenella intestinihominis]
MEQVKKKTDWRGIIFLQAIIVIYTFSSVCGKMATHGNEFMSRMFIIYILLDFVLLAVYALLWQQGLKRFDLNVAYANRSVAIIWSMVWSALIFREGITVANIIGTAIIITGTMLVNTDAESK